LSSIPFYLERKDDNNDKSLSVSDNDILYHGFSRRQ